MNFCAKCGNPVVQKIPEGDNRERHVCGHCGTIHYQNPRIIAGSIPTFDNKVLLCKRAIEPRHGYWTLPAGFMENGETVMEGALRESMEEANAILVDPVLSCMFDIPHINQVYIFYRGELGDMNFGPGIESLEVELFTKEQIPWQELAFPVVGMALRKYFEDSENGNHQIHTGIISMPWWEQKKPSK